MITSAFENKASGGRLRSLNANFVAGMGRVAALILLVVIMSFASPVFFTVRNLSEVVTDSCIMIIVGVGETIAIITRGADLSVGSILTITGVIAAIMVKAGIPFVWAILAALAFGGLLGWLNGFLISKIGLPSFISTYGLMWALFGFAYLILNGYVIYNFDASFRFLGNGHLFGVVPMPIVVMVIVVVAAGFLMKRTTVGRKLYAVGANPDTAKMSGIKISTTIMLAFVLSGVLAALGGVVLIGRINAVQADIGNPYLLMTLAIVLMGGTSLGGGQGSIVGTVIGGLIISIVQNAMNLLGIPSVWHDAMIGALILLTVLTDISLRKGFARLNAV